MKKYLCLFVVMFICLTVYADNFAYGQEIYKKEFDIATPGITHKLESESLTVILNNWGENDVLAVEPNFMTKAMKLVRVKGWEINYSQNSNNSRLNPLSIDQINVLGLDGSVNFQRGTLVINGQGQGNENKRSVIHLNVPLGINTKIYLEKELLYSRSISVEGLSLENKAVKVEKVGSTSEERTLARSISKTNKPIPTTYKRIDWKTLSSLTVKSVSSPTTFRESGESWAIVEVEVEESGKVKGILYAGGNEALAATSRQFLSQYEFKPFLVDDKPMRVKSLVPVSVVKGQIKVFSEAK